MVTETLEAGVLDDPFGDPSTEATVIDRASRLPPALLTELHRFEKRVVRQAPREVRAAEPVSQAGQSTMVGELLPHIHARIPEALTAHLPVPMTVDDLIAEEREREVRPPPGVRSSPPAPVGIRELVAQRGWFDARTSARRAGSWTREPEVSSPLVVPLMDFSEEDVADAPHASFWDVPVVPLASAARAASARPAASSASAMAASLPIVRAALPRAHGAVRLGSGEGLEDPRHAVTRTYHFDAIPAPGSRPATEVKAGAAEEVHPQRYIRTQLIEPALRSMGPEPTQKSRIVAAATALLDFDALTVPPKLVSPYLGLGLAIVGLVAALVHVL